MTVSDSTIRKNVLTLNKVFTWAVQRGYMKTNPAAPHLVERPPESRPNPTPLSDHHIKALMIASPGWFRPLVTMALNTGMDKGELEDVEWDRIDRGSKVLMVARTKTGVPRRIPYGKNPTIQRLLRESLKETKGRGHVFLKDGRPIASEVSKTAMRRAWERAEIPFGKPWKSLRSTFCTRLLDKGVDSAKVAKLMGWTTSYVLEHYYQPTQESMEDAMGVLGFGMDSDNRSAVSR